MSLGRRQLLMEEDMFMGRAVLKCITVQPFSIVGSTLAADGQVTTPLHTTADKSHRLACRFYSPVPVP